MFRIPAFMCCAAWLLATRPLLTAAGRLQWPLTGKPSYSDDQYPLPPISLTQSRNYSVGISLASSYGSAAVIVDDAVEGTKVYSWVVHGDVEYQQTMAKLSMEDFQHLAPPYESIEEQLLDAPRKLGREVFKKLGLPASADVGALASMIRSLRTRVEAELPGCLLPAREDAAANTTAAAAAVVGTPDLVALYADDVADACEHAGLACAAASPPAPRRPPVLHEAAGALAGHGLGLCAHWRDAAACAREDAARPRTHVLAVHYSRTALTAALVPARVAAGAAAPDGWHVEDFSLGRIGRARYDRDEDYWSDVKRAILMGMPGMPSIPRPDQIILTGEVDDAQFMGAFNEAMEEYLGTDIPPIYSDSPMVVAAVGNAEFRRRSLAYWPVVDC